MKYIVYFDSFYDRKKVTHKTSMYIKPLKNYKKEEFKKISIKLFAQKNKIEYLKGEDKKIINNNKEIYLLYCYIYDDEKQTIQVIKINNLYLLRAELERYGKNTREESIMGTFEIGNTTYKNKTYKIIKEDKEE